MSPGPCPDCIISLSCIASVLLGNYYNYNKYFYLVVDWLVLESNLKVGAIASYYKIPLKQVLVV